LARVNFTATRAQVCRAGLVAVKDGLLISVNVSNGLASQPDRDRTADVELADTIVPPVGYLTVRGFAFAVELLRDRGLISDDVPDRRYQDFAKALVAAFVSNGKDTTAPVAWEGRVQG
jgi:hypothetical protein